MENWYPGHYKSLATANILSIRGGPTRLGWLTVSNSGAAAAFLKLYNTAGNPASTDTPKLVIRIPATNGQVPIPLPADGVMFPLGLGIRIVTLIGDSDATAIGADEVIVNYGIA